MHTLFGEAGSANLVVRHDEIVHGVAFDVFGCVRRYAVGVGMPPARRPVEAVKQVSGDESLPDAFQGQSFDLVVDVAVGQVERRFAPPVRSCRQPYPNAGVLPYEIAVGYDPVLAVYFAPVQQAVFRPSPEVAFVDERAVTVQQGESRSHFTVRIAVLGRDLDIVQHRIPGVLYDDSVGEIAVAEMRPPHQQVPCLEHPRMVISGVLVGRIEFDRRTVAFFTATSERSQTVTVSIFVARLK